MRTFLISVSFLTVFTLAESQSVKTLDLSGTWKVTWNEGGHGPQNLEAYIHSDPADDPARFIDVSVPMELHRRCKKQILLKILIMDEYP